MSMTTPRVTVPVDDWKHVIGALKNAKARLGPGAAICNVSAALAKVEHLSAAPAPEGGAVDSVRSALAPFAHIASHVGLPRDGTVHLTSLDGTWIATIEREAFWKAQAALATREEAPEEAGEDFRAQVVKLVDELIAHIVAIGPDKPDVNTPMSRRVWREVFADQIIALRAQPPARSARRPNVGEIEKTVLIWMSEGETGLSSMSLARETAGLPHPIKGSFGGIWAPSDPGDLRRCRLLIEAVPEARQAVDSLARKDDGWRGLAADWDEINRLYDEEAAGGWQNAAHPTYVAMKKALGQ